MLSFLRLVWLLAPVLGVAAELNLSPAIQSTFRILGRGFDVGGLGVDSAGNTYVAGSVNGGFAPANTQILGPAGTNPSLFVAKISASGKELLYLTEILDSHPQYDRLGGMAVQPDGSVILDGGTQASDFPTTAGSLQAHANQGGAFLLKLDPNGQKLLFSTYLDDSAQTAASGLSLDSEGNCYLGGSTDGQTFPTTVGAFQRSASAAPGGVGFVSKISADGKKLLLSTLIADSNVTNIAVDSVGAIHITGPTALALLNASASQLIYSKSFSYIYWRPLGIDRQGNSYTVGNGGYLISEILKIDPTGAVVYDKQIPGAGFSAILVLGDGTVFAGGRADAPYFPTRDSLQPCNTNLQHDSVPVQWWLISAAFLVLDPAGNIVHSSFLGGGAPAGYGNDDNGIGLIAQDPNGLVSLLGFTTSPDFPGGPVLLSGPPGITLTYTFGMKVDLNKISKGRPAPACLALITALEAPAMPATLMTIFGSNLGPTLGVYSQLNASDRVPVEVAGTQVTVGGIAAPILYAQDQQINFIAPQGITGTTTDICVATNETQSCLFSYVGSRRPGIFRVGEGYAVLNQDGTLNTPDNPAAAGSVISLFGTGFGPFDGLPPDGSLAMPPYARLIYPVTATFEVLYFSGEGDILYAGAAPFQVSGVTQINVRIPDFSVPGHVRVSVDVVGGTVPSFSPAVIAIIDVKRK